MAETLYDSRQHVADKQRLASTFANLSLLVPIVVFGFALMLYLRTGAPTILTGDQAEHQYTAALVGVPHATGYPLFTMINALAVRLLPYGDIARRVTIMTGVWSALAVALTYIVARSISGKILGGLVAASALACSHEFWSLATIAEVYALQACMILLIWWCLLRWWDAPERRGWLYAAAFCAGLATTHHGSFVPIVVPALLLVVALPLLMRPSVAPNPRARWLIAARATGWGVLGLAPWLYLAAQFILFRPFDYYRGQGMPYHYYWGYPANWSDVANLALGAGFREKVFTHGWDHFVNLTLHFGATLRQEMWWTGLLLGMIGGIWLLSRQPRSGRFSALIFICAALFGINVAGDVPKAHVYYLPAYVVWSVWAGVGASWLLQVVERRPFPNGQRSMRWIALASANLLMVGLLLIPLARGWRNWDRYDRSSDDVPRRFASAVLAKVAPNAAILCRWELCEAIRYLQFAEGQRLDVVLDQTEPEAGADWAERAALYLPTRPVYAAQFNQQLADHYALFPVLESEDLWQVQIADQ